METLKLGNFYLTGDSKIVQIVEDLDYQNPILGFGEIFTESSDFNHIASDSLDYEKALQQYGEARVVGVGVYKHSDYSFFRSDDTPALFFVLDPSVVEGVDDETLETMKRGFVDDFESWYCGFCYETRILDLEGEWEESRSYLGINWERFVNEDFDIFRDITHLVRAKTEAKTDSEASAIIDIIKSL